MPQLLTEHLARVPAEVPLGRRGSAGEHDDDVPGLMLRRRRGQGPGAPHTASTSRTATRAASGRPGTGTACGSRPLRRQLVDALQRAAHQRVLSLSDRRSVSRKASTPCWYVSMVRQQPDGAAPVGAPHAAVEAEGVAGIGGVLQHVTIHHDADADGARRLRSLGDRLGDAGVGRVDRLDQRKPARMLGAHLDRIARVPAIHGERRDEQTRHRRRRRPSPPPSGRP